MKTIKSIIAVLIASAMIITSACGGKGTKEVKEKEASAPATIEVSISGMTCTGCEQTVQGGVSKLDGVKSVKADFKTGKALVGYDPAVTDTAAIRTAITGTGYKVNGFSTPQKPE